MHIAYDLESFPNVFTCCVAPIHEDGWWVYEISERRNDARYLFEDVTKGRFTRMYGYRSMGYDYPLLHHLIKIIGTWGFDLPWHYLADAAYQKTLELIAAPWGKDWVNHIWPREQWVPQCDLMMLNHFDNAAKLTSLKDLEFNLRCPTVAEMPFEPGTRLTVDQIHTLIAYNYNDTVPATRAFAHACMDAIKFREGLMEKGLFGPECLNWNDVKIGEKFFINRLEQSSPGITRKDVHGRKPQTFRGNIPLADVILPYVGFHRPELRTLLDQLRGIVVNGQEIKGSYNFKVPLEGVEISIGAGGIHGSLDRHVAKSDGETCIIDIDVTGYYPSVAIVNGFYPEHIGPVFTTVYRSIRDERATAKKSGDLVAAGTLKLSNNGAFGKTNDKHSVLLDPKCMLAITINGQLLQCMLAEVCLRVPGARLLQLNTDGLTFQVPRSHRDRFDEACAWWQRQTCLELEFTEYQAMWLRDCNNYIALDTKGKRKRKGDYDWEMLSGSIGGQKAWNRDFSALVVPKAVETALIDDVDPGWFIANHDDAYDFLLRKRVKGGAKLINGHTGADLGKVVRYYIAQGGFPLVSVQPPLRGKTEPRRIGVHAEGQAEAVGSRKNWKCSTCGEAFPTKEIFEGHNRDKHGWGIALKMHWDGDLTGIDYRWYEKSAEALIF